MLRPVPALCRFVSAFLVLTKSAMTLTKMPRRRQWFTLVLKSRDRVKDCRVMISWHVQMVRQVKTSCKRTLLTRRRRRRHWLLAAALLPVQNLYQWVVMLSLNVLVACDSGHSLCWVQTELWQLPLVCYCTVIISCFFLLLEGTDDQMKQMIQRFFVSQHYHHYNPSVCLSVTLVICAKKVLR